MTQLAMLLLSSGTDTNLDGGESLLRAVFDGTSAALGQVASSVLGLWLDEDLQLLPIAPLGELGR